MLVCGAAAEITQRLGGDAASGDLFSYAVTHAGGAVLDVVEVETSDDRCGVVIDEHIERAGAAGLLRQESIVMLAERRKELITAVVDEPSEVGAIVNLEETNRVQVVSSQQLQPEHTPRLSAAGLGSAPGEHSQSCSIIGLM